MPSAPVRVELGQLQAQPDIQHQADRRAVGGDRRPVAQQPPSRRGARSAPPARGHRPGAPRLRAAARAAPSSASTTASSPGSAASSMPRAPPSAGMPRARARMAAWPAGLASSIATPAMPRPCQSSSSAGPSRRASRMAPCGTGPAGAVAEQGGQQPAGQVLQVGQPLAQIGVGDAAHAVAQFAGDALHRRLGGDAAADHLADPAQPAGIGGDQAVGLQHLARARHRPLPPSGTPAAISSSSPRCIRSDRGVQPAPAPPPGRRPAGAAARAAAPCSTHRADGDAAGRAACRRRRAGRWRRRPPPPPSAAPPAGQQLGQQHGHRFQLVDLLVGVVARRAVLHRQHAQRAAGAAHRHREHRGERLLAGLRPVGEGRVVLRVRQVHHLRRWRRTRPTMPSPTRSRVRPTALRLQPLGGGQLQDVARPQHVDRAHLADQLGGDQPHQLGQRRRAVGHQVRAAGPAGGVAWPWLVNLSAARGARRGAG